MLAPQPVQRGGGGGLPAHAGLGDLGAAQEAPIAVEVLPVVGHDHVGFRFQHQAELIGAVQPGGEAEAPGQRLLLDEAGIVLGDRQGEVGAGAGADQGAVVGQEQADLRGGGHARLADLRRAGRGRRRTDRVGVDGDEVDAGLHPLKHEAVPRIGDRGPGADMGAEADRGIHRPHRGGAGDDPFGIFGGRPAQGGLGVMVAVVGLVGHFEPAHPPGLGMAPGGAFLRPRMGGIGRGVEVLDQGGGVGGVGEFADVDQRLGLGRLAEGQVFVEAEGVVGALAQRPDRLLPVEVVGQAAARIAQHAQAEGLRPRHRFGDRPAVGDIPGATAGARIVGIDLGAEDALAVGGLEVVAEHQAVDRTQAASGFEEDDAGAGGRCGGGRGRGRALGGAAQAEGDEGGEQTSPDHHRLQLETDTKDRRRALSG